MGFALVKRIESDSWERLLESNRPYLQCFFKNVDYLCRVRYGSRNKGLKALRDELGYAMLSQTVKAFTTGEYRQCDLMKLSAWCIVLNERMDDLMSKDYKKEGII